MANIPLKIPPGFLRKGTLYSAVGRWYTGNFVRFEGVDVKPVGGWAYQSDQSGVIQLTGVPRGALGWEVSGGRNWQAFGTCGATTKQYAFSLGTLYDITYPGTLNLILETFTYSDGTDLSTIGWYTNGGSGYAAVYGNTAHPLVSVYGRYTTSAPLVDGSKYEVYADITKDVSGSELGIMFLVNDSGAVGNVGRFYMKYVSATLVDFIFDRFDGSYNDTWNVVQNVAVSNGEGRRVGVTVDHINDTITPWLEPLGGGTRTTYAQAGWTAPTWFTDGTHKSVGFWFQAVGSTTTGWRFDNYSVDKILGLTASKVDSSMGTGSGATYYGSGLYGDGTYGSGQPAGVLTEADVWHVDNFGNLLVMCQVPTNDSIYEWNPTTPSTPASVVTNAPLDNRGIVVTPERFLVALGAAGNVRLVQWSDRENRNVWTPLSTNEAGSYELEGKGRIMAGARGRSETLIWTDADLFVMQYIGPPYVYSFLKKGSQCGLVAPHAKAEVNGMHVWMGLRNFFIYDGYVRSLPCEVSDYVFSDMNRDQRIKIHAWVNHEFREVWWFYPSSGSTEIDRYVAWNYDENWWITGFMDRTSAIAATSTNVKPVLTNSSGYVFLHESGWDHTIEQATMYTPYVESGPVEIGSGDRTLHITKIIPDENTLGDVLATLYVSFFPTEAETSVGPFTASTWTDARAHGRWARLYLSESTADDWRVGIYRLDVKQGGRR